MKPTLQLFAIMLCAFNMYAQELPYSCNFDTQTSQDGWLYYEEGVEGVSDWNMSGGGFSAPNALTHDYNVGASTDDLMIDWMVSPSLITTGPISIELMVRQMGFSTPTDDNCELYMITGDPNPENGGAVFIANLSNPGPSATWIPQEFLFTSIVGEFRIAFRYKTLGAAWCTYAIDDISISLSTNIPNLEKKDVGENLMIYPNPVNDKFYVNGIDIFENPKLTLFDATGRTIENNIAVNHTNGSIDISNLKSGCYSLRIEDSIGRFATKSIFKL